MVTTEGSSVSPELFSRAQEHVKPTTIPGLYVLERPVHRDERGFFHEIVRLDELEAMRGEPFRIVQANHSESLPGVIRALHAEGWNKLVYPGTSEMYAALVDIRPESSTFGQVETFRFGPNNRIALFIPKGVANPICVTGKEPVEYFYMVDAKYDGTDQTAIAWDDPDLNIKWPVENPIISKRDRTNPGLRKLFPEKFPGDVL